MNNSTILKKIVHIICRTNYKDKCIKNFAKNIKNKKILEFGSGKKVKGRYIYSDKKYFDSSNKFVRSDIVKGYGHKIIDITNIKQKEEFDIILCLNVLEHVFEYKKAIFNMHKTLKKNGKLILLVPSFYPLHDEPNDFWRFTRHSLERLLKDFKKVKIKHSGLNKLPFFYYVEAIK